MGWCSATEIMDTAVKAADAIAERLMTSAAEVYGHTAAEAQEAAARLGVQGELDAVLSPFVSAIANALRDGDWDCIEESEFYDRFAQEMQGDSDEEYEERLIEGLREADPVDRRSWVERLNRHHEKMGRTDGAG